MTLIAEGQKIMSSQAKAQGIGSVCLVSWSAVYLSGCSQTRMEEDKLIKPDLVTDHDKLWKIILILNLKGQWSKAIVSFLKM